METIPNQNPPDERELEALLGAFKPHPSVRFYKRLSDAAWQPKPSSYPSQPIKKLKLDRRLIWSIIALVLFILITGLAFIPAARVAASQIIHFFLPASSNQLEIQVNPDIPQSMLDFSNPANYPLSVAEVQGIARYPIKQLASPPENVNFTGARYEPSYNAVILLYDVGDYQLFLTQRPLKGGQDVFSIGADAQIELVRIGPVQGEYVQGGWQAVSTPGVAVGKAMPTDVAINAIWNNKLPQSTLRWQSGGQAYELRASGDKLPSQLELINWANGLK